VPPVKVDTEFVTFFNVNGDGSTKTGAIVARITGTGVKFTIFVVWLWINVLMAFSERGFSIGKLRASLDSPWPSVSIGLTWRNNIFSFFARTISPPRVTEFKNVVSTNSLAGDHIVTDRTIVITAKTFNLFFVFWMNSKKDGSTLVPSELDFFGRKEQPPTSGFHFKFVATLVGLNWLTFDKTDFLHVSWVVIVDSELDGFSADCTGRTAWLVLHSNSPSTVLSLSKNVVASPLKFKIGTIEGSVMRITIGSALSPTSFFGTFPF